jgi:hypothetical protein
LIPARVAEHRQIAERTSCFQKRRLRAQPLGDLLCDQCLQMELELAIELAIEA